MKRSYNAIRVVAAFLSDCAQNWKPMAVIAMELPRFYHFMKEKSITVSFHAERK
jgi:hypothetical protein